VIYKIEYCSTLKNAIKLFAKKWMGLDVMLETSSKSQRFCSYGVSEFKMVKNKNKRTHIIMGHESKRVTVVWK
jgi:hypothetical protein